MTDYDYVKAWYADIFACAGEYFINTLEKDNNFGDIRATIDQGIKEATSPTAYKLRCADMLNTLIVAALIKDGEYQNDSRK